MVYGLVVSGLNFHESRTHLNKRYLCPLLTSKMHFSFKGPTGPFSFYSCLGNPFQLGLLLPLPWSRTALFHVDLLIHPPLRHYEVSSKYALDALDASNANKEKVRPAKEL